MVASFAWRNLWRHPRRTALSVAAIAFAVTLLVFLISFDRGVADTMKNNSLRVYDGFAQLQGRGYSPDADMRKTIVNPGAIVGEISGLAGISGAAPRVTAFAVIANQSRSFGVTVVGVDPTREPSVSTLASTVHYGRFLTALDSDAAVIGEVLAKNLRVRVGDRITLLGSAWDGSVAADILQVVGIFRSRIGDLDQQVVQIPLARAQQTFAFGDRANVVAISASTFAHIERATPALRDLARRFDADFADWTILQPSLRDSIAIKTITSGLFYATLILVVVFITLNTLLMSVLERTREFGVLISIGMRPVRVGWAVWLELVILVLAGSLLGLGFGGAATFWMERRGMLYPNGGGQLLAQFGLPDRLYPSLDAFSALAAPAVIVIATCALGLAAVVRISKLEAISAMRMPA